MLEKSSAETKTTKPQHQIKKLIYLISESFSTVPESECKKKLEMRNETKKNAKSQTVKNRSADKESSEMFPFISVMGLYINYDY